jgi:hypothetical protein
MVNSRCTTGYTRRLRQGEVIKDKREIYVSSFEKRILVTGLTAGVDVIS